MAQYDIHTSRMLSSNNSSRVHPRNMSPCNRVSAASSSVECAKIRRKASFLKNCKALWAGRILSQSDPIHRANLPWRDSGEPLRSWSWQQGGVITFPPKMESTLWTRIPSYRKTRLPRQNSRAAAASPAHAAAAPASECWCWMSPATYPIFLGSLSPASRTVHYAHNHSQGIINV